MSDIKRQITEADKVHLEWYEQAKKTTIDTLAEFIRHLSEDYTHDYGTICHAVAAAGLAAMGAVDKSPQGGITGFQSGYIAGKLIAEWQHIKCPFEIRKYDDFLYPQYKSRLTTIPKEAMSWLRTEAKKRLAKDPEQHMSENVRAHMQSLAAGNPPFGFTVEES